MEDQERLGEQAKESRVCLKKEVTKVYHELLGLEDLFKGSEVADELYLSNVVVSAVKDDMLSCMMVGSGPM